ncbi:TPA: beta-galactosidase [Candidatus Sumerlaeota bacterium]|nr:beta-galactosidase [Candidatus Sumerlaeota bacterium]
MKKCLPLFVLSLLFTFSFIASVSAQSVPGKHTFSIGDKDFLLDNKPFVIRTGEMHFARVPHEYWRNRMQTLKAMGMNAVCVYLFWNFHEWEPGQYNWSEQADAAEFCRIAQEEGLWVILRPGPYSCAEWDGGGVPWWLLKKEDIKLRSQDPDFMKAATAWYKEVGRVLSPLQITHGGPILMAQVENEYGIYGEDVEYMGRLRQALVDSGFDVPLFACNPVSRLKMASHPDLFKVVNFGRDAENAANKLRAVQPQGPLMCGEFYPGWFDTWGATHHLGNPDQYYSGIEYMLKNRMSFSLYMAHGGTSFGMWPGVDRPFKPDTNSYDYDAPISEAGWTTEKFQKTRALVAQYLEPGEILPDPPAQIPTMSIPKFRLKETAPVFDNLPPAITDTVPHSMESYDQGHGCAVYRTELPAGPAATLQVEYAHDFAWVFVDGKQVGVMDRRSNLYSVKLPARKKAAQLDVLVEAMGHVNFGPEIHDRKGLQGPVQVLTGNTTSTLEGKWQVFPLRLDDAMLGGLKWKSKSAKGPSFWRGSFNVEKPADTFLDLGKWGKGVIWVNGHCLSRFWNIGPTQTAYMPGAWLKPGKNEIIILDLLGPAEPVVAGLDKPILGELRIPLDFVNRAAPKTTLLLEGVAPLYSGSFPSGSDTQTIKLSQPAKGTQFCFEMLNAHDGKPFAAIAELDLLDLDGNSISHLNWKIGYVDSEERVAEDGSGSNAIDGQVANYWHSEWKNKQPNFPHRLVIDLGKPTTIGAFRYTPCAGANANGQIKDYRVYFGNGFTKEAKK